jgi:hypothetical protein
VAVSPFRAGRRWCSPPLPSPRGTGTVDVTVTTAAGTSPRRHRQGLLHVRHNLALLGVLVALFAVFAMFLGLASRARRGVLLAGWWRFKTGQRPRLAKTSRAMR